MDEQITPQATSETVATPAPIPTPTTPQQSARDAVYAKYYEPQSQSAPNLAIVESAVVDGVDGGQSQATAHVEPEPPAPAPTPTPDPNALLLAKLEAMQAEITALRNPAPPTPKIEQPAAPEFVGDDAVANEFLKLMSEGKAPEAIKALKAAISREVEESSKVSVTREVEERLETQGRIKSFVDNIRTENPDIIPMEDWISARVQQHIAVAQQSQLASGKGWGLADVEREYKAAVSAEVENAKKFVQQIRGAGKQEGLTTQQRVVSSQPVPPNSITSNRPDTTPSAPQPESAQDYLAKRLQQNWAKRGIGATA